jgi:NADH-quinone oxidoreductase subunit K
MNIDLAIWLATAIMLFIVGLYGLISKSDGLKMVFAIEIMVCAANMALIGVGYLLEDTSVNPASQSFTLLSLGVGGAIVGIALAMLTMLYKAHGNINLHTNMILRW